MFDLGEHVLREELGGLWVGFVEENRLHCALELSGDYAASFYIFAQSGCGGGIVLFTSCILRLDCSTSDLDALDASGGFDGGVRTGGEGRRGVKTFK